MEDFVIVANKIEELQTISDRQGTGTGIFWKSEKRTPSSGDQEVIFASRVTVMDNNTNSRIISSEQDFEALLKNRCSCFLSPDHLYNIASIYSP